MNQSAMRQFLSEENITRHKDYLNSMRGKLSIIEKSFNDKKNMDIKTRNEYNYLRKCISSHELFFNSFKLSSGKCANIKKYFSSKERFIYDLMEISKNKESGFIYVYVDKRKTPQIDYSTDFSDPYSKFEPILAFDLYEHVYFADYGFKKADFLKNALVYLDLDALDCKLS